MQVDARALSLVLVLLCAVPTLSQNIIVKRVSPSDRTKPTPSLVPIKPTLTSDEELSNAPVSSPPSDSDDAGKKTIGSSSPDETDVADDQNEDQNKAEEGSHHDDDSKQNKEEEVKASQQDDGNQNKDEMESQRSGDEEGIERPKFFLNSFRTQMNTNVQIATTTVFSSCLMAVSEVACLGRRKRRNIIKDMPEQSDGVDSSGSGSGYLDPSNYLPGSGMDLKESYRDPRFAFTVWTAITTTTTVTTVYTNPSITVSLSFQCTVGFMATPSNVCAG